MKKIDNGDAFILNPKLISLVSNWQDAGSPVQEKFNWSARKPVWESTFPNHEEFIEGLPSAIGRGDVRLVCESTQNSIIEKFLTVMIWGYGDRGYGPFRVSKMLGQEGTIHVLTQAHEFCQNGNPKAAYKFLALNRIYMLGPSYGSKFITFCVPRDVGAPIYDSLISMWISEFASKEFQNVGTSSERWNLSTYSRYWDWVKIHSEYLGCFPDEIEFVLFRDAELRFSKASNWAGK
jgi:hypothetical protein